LIRRESTKYSTCVPYGLFSGRFFKEVCMEKLGIIPLVANPYKRQALVALRQNLEKSMEVKYGQ